MPTVPIPARLSRLPTLAALAVGLAVFAWTAAAQGHTEATNPENGQQQAAAALDNEQLETALQSLSWDQFKAVVSAIPKLKADVDAYGPLGWQYVQANYKTYPWRKNIRKLHEPQKRRLSELIDEARAGGKPSAR